MKVNNLPKQLIPDDSMSTSHFLTQTVDKKNSCGEKTAGKTALKLATVHQFVSWQVTAQNSKVNSIQY